MQTVCQNLPELHQLPVAIIKIKIIKIKKLYDFLEFVGSNAQKRMF
jgi:hypothetical protein